MTTVGRPLYSPTRRNVREGKGENMGGGVGEFQLYKTSAEQGRVKVSGKKEGGGYLWKILNEINTPPPAQPL